MYVSEKPEIMTKAAYMRINYWSAWCAWLVHWLTVSRWTLPTSIDWVI